MGENRGRGQSRSLGSTCMHSSIKMDDQQGPAVETGHSAQCYVAAWMGGELEGGVENGRLYVYG